MCFFGPKEADFGSKRANFGPERGNFRSKRVDLGLIALISGLKEPDLDLSGRGGGTYGRTDGRTDGRTYVIFSPCVLQDIGPLGPLPKKGWNLKTFLASLPLHMSFDLFESLRLTVCESITQNCKNALFCPIYGKSTIYQFTLY